MKRSLKIWIPIGIFLALLIYFGGTYWYYFASKGVTENIVFQTGDVQLVGIIMKPKGQGPHPAIVFAHGSGPETHDEIGSRIFGNEFVRRGFAVLVYDKRGAGASGGDFSRLTFEDLANDIAAGVQFLRSRKDILPNQIGLLGSSEGGWVTPLAATKADNIAFIINRAGPTVPWLQTFNFEWENTLRKEGYSDTEIEEALELKKQIWTYYRDASLDSTLASGIGLATIKQTMEDAKDKRWYDRMPLYFEPWDQNKYSSIADFIFYDPLPYLKQLNCPLLAIYAGKDKNTPTAKCLLVIEDLKTVYNKDITTKVYPNVEHSMTSWKDWLPGGGVFSDFLELIGSWAQQQLEGK